MLWQRLGRYVRLSSRTAPGVAAQEPRDPLAQPYSSRWSPEIVWCGHRRSCEISPGRDSYPAACRLWWVGHYPWYWRDGACLGWTQARRHPLWFWFLVPGLALAQVAGPAMPNRSCRVVGNIFWASRELLLRATDPHAQIDTRTPPSATIAGCVVLFESEPRSRNLSSN
jgi:hypothetical protein